MESPPNSKKLSWTLTRSSCNRPAQMPASNSSAGFRGATNSLTSSIRRGSGAGSALRSILPATVKGSAARSTKAEGTMYSGKRWRR